jgi:hypothetical protein
MIVLSSHCVPSSRDHVDGKKRTIPVCFSRENLTLLEKYAKKKGMTNYGQAVESPATQNIQSRLTAFMQPST